MTTITCYKCGIDFAVPSHWNNSRHEDKDTFWCPNGHAQSYTTGSLEILRREKEASERLLQAKLNEEKHARLVAERARDKAIRDKRAVERRIAHGICPCCNKTFADLSNHMVTEHKDFRLPGGKRQKQIAGAA